MRFQMHILVPRCSPEFYNLTVGPQGYDIILFSGPLKYCLDTPSTGAACVSVLPWDPQLQGRQQHQGQVPCVETLLPARCAQ